MQEKLYIELKNILGRQPGSEVIEQLAVYQENLKHKVPPVSAFPVKGRPIVVSRSFRSESTHFRRSRGSSDACVQKIALLLCSWVHLKAFSWSEYTEFGFALVKVVHFSYAAKVHKCKENNGTCIFS